MQTISSKSCRSSNLYSSADIISYKKTDAGHAEKHAKKLSDWSRSVRERDHWKCAVCGQEKGVQAHHIISKLVRSLSLVLENGISLCPYCHNLRKLSAHKNPVWFMKWLQEHRPEQYDFLKSFSEENFES